MALTSVVVSLTVWLSREKPALAGFIVALPITTLLVLPLSHSQFENPENSVLFARSIFVAVPLSLLFFLPFLFSKLLRWGFWPCYLSGIVLLVLGYFAHRWFFSVSS